MQGTSRLIDNLQRLGQEAPRALGRVLEEVAMDVQNRATMMAPVEFGHLRESASTEISEAPGSIVATVGFNATTKDGKYSYALIQHERTDFHHPLGGEAKYLEKAMNAVASDFEARIGDGVEKFPEGAGAVSLATFVTDLAAWLAARGVGTVGSTLFVGQLPPSPLDGRADRGDRRAPGRQGPGSGLPHPADHLQSHILRCRTRGRAGRVRSAQRARHELADGHQQGHVLQGTAATHQPRRGRGRRLAYRLQTSDSGSLGSESPKQSSRPLLRQGPLLLGRHSEIGWAATWPT